jgi:hypothetical protein
LIFVEKTQNIAADISFLSRIGMIIMSFEKVKKAITSLKRSKEKLSINKIAQKAGIL